MRQTTFLLPVFLILSAFSMQAQGYCSGDTVVFTEPGHPVDYADLVYKTAPQIDEWNFDVPENIRLRVYYPTDLPAGEKRPLIVLVHGGYFIWGSYLDFDAFAKLLAEKGFIAATVGYRLCKRGDCVIAASLNLPCQVSWGYSFFPSSYVAAVDVNDGIRWLQQHAGDYHIDPEAVTVAGHSAGAFTALNVAFLDQNEIQEQMPNAGVYGKYLGEPLDPVSGIRACVPMAGAFVNLDWIDSSETEQISVGIVHGTSDGVVDYDESVAIPCCQTYSAIVHGGCDVAHRVKALGGNYYLLTGDGFGHDIGEPLLYDALSVQVPAFVIKTVLCGQSIQKQCVVTRPTPLPMCPGNNPNLASAPVCDVDPATPFITTPVIEAPGGQVDPSLELLVYPTVTTGQVQVRAIAPEAGGDWQLTVFGLDGRVLRQTRLDLSGSATVELGNLPAGTYNLFFRSMKDGRSGVLRLLKQ